MLEQQEYEIWRKKWTKYFMDRIDGHAKVDVIKIIEVLDLMYGPTRTKLSR